MLKKIKLKARLFYLPYFVISTVFPVLYTCIIWYFYIRNGKIHSVNYDLQCYLIPAISILILTGVFLTPKLRFAIFRNGMQIGGMVIFTILSAMFAAITTATILRYIIDTSSQVVHLKNTFEIENKPLYGFYTFENIDIDPGRSFHEWGLSGKRRDRLNLKLIVPCLDAQSNTYSYWILEKRDSFIDKSTLAQDAYDKIRIDLGRYLDTVQYSKAEYFERSVHTETRRNIVEMVHKLSSNPKHIIILEPHFKPMSQRLKKEKYIALFAWLGFNLLWFIFSISIGVSTLKLYDHQQGKRLER